MEATKVKVRERDLAVRRHRTWHRILFLPPHPTPLLSTPLPSSPPRPRPRARFGIPVPRPASKTTPSYRKIELWWKPRPSWNRVTLRHACHVIAVRVSPRALRSRFRERLKSKKKKTKRRESLPLSLSSIEGRIRVICESTIDEERRLYTHRPVVTQRNAWMMNFYI